MAEKTKKELPWEVIEEHRTRIHNNDGIKIILIPILRRLWVPEGWLIKNEHASITFVPDSSHLWRI